MSESEIVSSICDYLALRRHLFWRSNKIPAFNRNGDGSIQMRRLPKYTMRGCPTSSSSRRGRFIGLEVKTETGRQSPEQKEFERLCKKHGGEYHLVRSIEDVQVIGL